MSLVEVGQCYVENDLSIHSTALNSMHSERLLVFLNKGLLGSIYHRYQGSTVT
jgi:hypothetical protein